MPGELKPQRCNRAIQQQLKANVISGAKENLGPDPVKSWVFTDLDGTLLDHDNYRWQAAEPALALLKASGIPLIINTSKTRAEVAELQVLLAPGMPFVIENGAAVVVPDDCSLIGDCSDMKADSASRVKVFGIPRKVILRALKPMRSDFSFTAFSELSVAELAALTQLPPSQAAMALQREYSEPLVWSDSDEKLAELSRLLNKQGLSVTRGGRFVHIAGPADKGTAMRWLADAAVATPTCLIALGDSENDRPMLEQSDWPIVVRTPAHSPLTIKHPKCRTTELTGPAGWNVAIQSLLQF